MNVHQNNKLGLAMFTHPRTFTVYICMPFKKHTLFFKVLNYVNNSSNFFNSVQFDILRAVSSLRLHISIIIIIILCVNDFKVKGDQTYTCFGLEREILCWHHSIRRMFVYEIALGQLCRCPGPDIWSPIRCFGFSFQLQVISLLVPNMYTHHRRHLIHITPIVNIIFLKDYPRLCKMVSLKKKLLWFMF